MPDGGREPTQKEKAKIAAGPRYDPGKPRPPWGKRSGDRTITSTTPIIKEAPPVTAPKPPPPPPPKPPTLEPVIPQPYVPPVGGVPVAWHSLAGAKLPSGAPDPYAIDKTKPTVLRTPDGLLHYTPYHHAMWESLGMRTSKDYEEYLRTGKPSEYVGVAEGVDKPVLVSRRELAKTAGLVGEEQFKALVEVGVIPRGSKFMPGPGGYKGKDWSFIDPKTLKKMKGAVLARLARRSTKKPRVVIPPEMRAEPHGVPEPTGVRGGPPMAPLSEILAAKPHLEELLTKPHLVINKLKEAPSLPFIQQVIKDWQEAVEHFQQEVLEIKQGKLHRRLKTILDEVTGFEQKEFFDRMGEYNKQVIEYNSQVDKMNEKVKGLEKEGAKLSIDVIKEYNKTMAGLNARALSLEREAPGVNLESEGAVNRFNAKINTLASAFEVLQGQEAKINASVQEVDKFNVKVEQFNIEVAGLKEPGEAPPEPLKTPGTLGRAIYEGIKAEYKHAARAELTLKEKVSNVSLLTAELVVPGVWVAAPYTGTDIKDRKLGEILLNIGLDMFIVVPLLRMATLGIKRALGATAKGMIREAIKAEVKVTKEAVKAMKATYGREVANALREVSHLQATYLKRLAKLGRMKAKGLTTTNQLRTTLKAENQLTTAARKFTNEVYQAQTRLGKKGVVGAGFDSPDIARAFYKMPEELVRHTKSTLQAITKPKGKKGVKQLEADVAKAEKVLKTAQAKFPGEPEKWTDLVGELLEKQAILSQRKAGGLGKTQSELARVNTELSRVKAKIFEATLKPPRVGRKPRVMQRRIMAAYQKQRRILKQTELNLERQRLELARKLKAGLRGMEIEWGRGGSVGRGGGGGTVVITQPLGATRLAVTSARLAVAQRIAGRGVAPALAGAGGVARAATRAELAITEAISKVIGRPVLERIAEGETDVEVIKKAEEEALRAAKQITKGLTDVEVIKMVESETLKAIRLAEKLATKPTTKLGVEAQLKLAAEIATRVRAALEEAVKAATSPKLATALEAKLAPIAEIAEKVATKTIKPIDPLKPIEPIIPLIPPPPKPGASDKEKREFANAQPGIAAYRRGALRGKSRWLVLYHPYGKDDKLELYGAPPRGAITFTGKGSAKKTAVVLRGKPPAKPISIDTGAVDDVIRSTDGRITLEHVKDVSGGKEVYRKGGITLSEKEPTKKGRTRVKELRDVLVRDAGAGVEETRGGRTHIPLEGQ